LAFGSYGSVLNSPAWGWGSAAAFGYNLPNFNLGEQQKSPLRTEHASMATE